MKGTVNNAKTSLSAEMFAGAMICVAQYLALLRYTKREDCLGMIES
jgi:hypothetical protein